MRILVSISGGGSFADYARRSGRLESTLEIVSDRPENRVPVDHVIPRRGNAVYWQEFTELALGFDLLFLNSNWIVPLESLERLSGIFVINQHPSLLPSFKGLNVWGDILASGATVSGCTFHLVTEDLDAGPIICQVAYPIPAGCTAEELSRINYFESRDVYVQVLRWFEQNRVRCEDGEVTIAGVSHAGRLVSPLLENE